MAFKIASVNHFMIFRRDACKNFDHNTGSQKCAHQCKFVRELIDLCA